MAINLSKLSSSMEDALERSRLLAEQRRQSLIVPAHLLYVLLDQDGPLAATPSRLGVSVSGVLEVLTGLINKETLAPLEAGKRARASRSLRELIEKSIDAAERRAAEMAEPTDFLLVTVELGDEDLRGALRSAGLTQELIEKMLSAQASVGEALGEDPGSRSSGPKSKSLERFGRDLTAEARNGTLMPVIGRDDEIRRVIQTLLRKTKNNPVLVGDPGTGKTAVVEGLALRIAAQDIPDSLKKCRVIALDLASMVAGAKYRGEFEERIKSVVDEVRSSQGEIILFLDELHTLVGAGGTEGGMDAANILKPALGRGELRCIGATTYDEYRERIGKDGALGRRFQVITVGEPSDENMAIILRGIRHRYETHHGVNLSEEALQASIKLSRRYLRDRFLPDKAIDIIDDAAARIRAQKESKPDSIDQMERSLTRKRVDLEALENSGRSAAQQKAIDFVRSQIDDLAPQVANLIAGWTTHKQVSESLRETRQAIEQQSALLAAAEGAGEVARAAEIRYGSLKFLEEQRKDLEKQLADPAMQGFLPDTVQAEHVAEVVAERVGIPIQRMLESERDRLLKLEDRIGARVFGQMEAVQAVSEAARRMRADLQVGRKPNSFLFVGPTGVGKTELAKALAEALFDDETALIRIDMGEFKDQSSAAGLIGSRPGLVGSDEGGFLTEQVRRSPYSVVLFDEVEKGHPEILNLLLGVLDEGRLTDAKGRFCDFSNTIVLFTSNLGVREAMEITDNPEKQKEIICEVVKASLRPEFYNRISQVIAFNSLTNAELERVVAAQIDQLRKHLSEEREIDLAVSPKALGYLAVQSYDPAYGARPVGRTLQRLVLSPLAESILAGDVLPKQTLQIDYSEAGGLTFAVEMAGAVAG